ncbi:hypothetical protein D3C85_1619200 [compost metagenome]
MRPRQNSGQANRQPADEPFGTWRTGEAGGIELHGQGRVHPETEQDLAKQRAARTNDFAQGVQPHHDPQQHAGQAHLHGDVGEHVVGMVEVLAHCTYVVGSAQAQAGPGMRGNHVDHGMEDFRPEG